MSRLSCEKPSSKFRVVLQKQGQEKARETTASCCPASAEWPKRIVQGLPTVSVKPTCGVLEPASGCSDAARRRYGGAIVRLSELQKNVGGVHSSGSQNMDCGVAANFGGKEGSSGAPRESSGIRACSKGDQTFLASSFANAASEPKGTWGGGGKRRMTRRGGRKSTPRRSRTAQKARRRRGGNSGGGLQMQPGREPCKHWWTTVGGRRQLHYGDRTYKGRAAHQLWDKIKAAIGSENLPATPSATAKRNNPMGRKRLRRETAPVVTSAQGEAHAREPETVHRAFLTAPHILGSSSRSKMLLLEERKEEEKKKLVTHKSHNTDVVLVSDDEDDVTSRSGSSPLSSWPSLNAGSSELSTSVTDMSDWSSPDEDDGDCEDFARSSLVSPSKDRSPCNRSGSMSSPAVVEHDGWLYPAELLSALTEQTRNAAFIEMGGCGTSGMVNTTPSEGCHKVGGMRSAHGITILGRGETQAAESVEVCPRGDMTTFPHATYSQRYEEMNALDDLLNADTEDLLDVGDEIGGVRFAP